MKINKSIKVQLLCVMLSIVIVPMLLSTSISYYNISKRTIADALNANEWQAWTTETEIEMEIERNISALVALAQTQTVIDFARGINTDEATMSKAFQGLDEYLGDGNQTIISNSTGEQLARSSGELINIADRDYFKEAMKGNIYISGQLFSKKTNENFMAICVPVKDNDGMVVGMLQRNYNTNALHNIITKYVDEGFIVDRDGIVIAHSDYNIKPGEKGEDLSKSKLMEGTEGSYLSSHLDVPKYVSWAVYEKTGMRVCIAQDQSAILEVVHHTTMASVLIAIIASVLAAVLAILYARSIVNPIKSIGDLIKDLSEGNISKQGVKTKREDELGIIINNTSSSMNTLTTVMSKIRSSSDDVGVQAININHSIQAIADTTSAVTDAMEQMAKAATDQAQNIEDANTSTQKFADVIQEVTDSSYDLAHASKEMEGVAEETQETLSNLTSQIQQMSVAITSIAETTALTSEAIDAMNEQVNSITEIATQVNLLSLNASIEAARAGDAGRGFAVVAEEIGKLAQTTADTTNNIKTEMSKLLTRATIASTDASSIAATNNEVIKVLHETTTTMSDLMQNISKTTEDINSITALAQECVASKEIIVDAMSNLSAISEENAASSEETSASMQQLNTTVGDLNATAEELANVAGVLNTEIDFFK